MTKKRALVLSAFNDAGTGESFAAGDAPMIDAGAFANYEAAGLITSATEAAKAAPKAKSTRKAAAKPASPAKAIAAAAQSAPVPPVKVVGDGADT